MKTTEPTEERLPLSPESMEELRGILSDESSANGIVTTFVKKFIAEMKPGPVTTLMDSVFTRQYQSSVRRIFQHVESPIEKIFFGSFLCSCLRNGVLVIVNGPPAGDFREAQAERRDHLSKLFKCHCFYKRLPEKPKDFRGFLEMTGVESGGLTTEEANMLAHEACVMFELAFVHTLHLTLQPTFKRFNGARSVRADSVLWIPSDEKFNLIIECDGFETHGTKDAFSKDRKRDRIFQSFGYQIRRYSGGEIHHQPIDSSSELVEFLIDQNKTKMAGQEWERELRSADGAAPSPEVVESWRVRMAAEQADQL